MATTNEPGRWLITGGTRGLGRALVLAVAADGGQVVFCGRSQDAGAAVCAAATEAGDGERVHFVAADVSLEADVEALFDAALERMGGLDVLVNNAAVLRDQLLISTDLADWNAVLGVNLRGPFLTSRRAVMELIADGGGAIINVGSIAGNGSAGQAAYAASKAGLLSLTRSLAKEYGRRGIRCNAVVPGYLETEMTEAFSADGRAARERLSPHRRFGRPEEVVAAIRFLASADASFVNGDALYVAGAVRDVPELR